MSRFCKNESEKRRIGEWEEDMVSGKGKEVREKF
jgi:hypothetical protein